MAEERARQRLQHSDICPVVAINRHMTEWQSKVRSWEVPDRELLHFRFWVAVFICGASIVGWVASASLAQMAKPGRTTGYAWESELKSIHDVHGRVRAHPEATQQALRAPATREQPHIAANLLWTRCSAIRIFPRRALGAKFYSPETGKSMEVESPFSIITEPTRSMPRMSA